MFIEGTLVKVNLGGFDGKYIVTDYGGDICWICKENDDFLNADKEWEVPTEFLEVVE